MASTLAEGETPCFADNREDVELETLRELSERATPGAWYLTGSPWFTSQDGILAGSPDGNIGYLIADCDDWNAPRDEYEGFPLGDKEDDAAFIVACVNYVRARLLRQTRRSQSPRC